MTLILLTDCLLIHLLVLFLESFLCGNVRAWSVEKLCNLLFSKKLYVGGCSTETLMYYNFKWTSVVMLAACIYFCIGIT